MEENENGYKEHTADGELLETGYAGYDGFSARTGEPLTEPVPKPIIIPEEAWNYTAGDHLIDFLSVMIMALPMLTGFVLLALYGLAGLDVLIPALCCIGFSVIAIPVYFLIMQTRRRLALEGRGVKNCAGTRHIEAEVIRCVCRVRIRHKFVTGAPSAQYCKIETVDAVYKVVLSAESKTFTAMCKTFYYPRESIFVYVNGRRAYIDEEEPCNKREKILKKS